MQLAQVALRTVIIMVFAIIRKKEVENLLHFVQSSIGEAVFATDLCANVLFMNRTAEKLTGYSKAEAYGKAIFEEHGFIVADKGTFCG